MKLHNIIKYLGISLAVFLGSVTVSYAYIQAITTFQQRVGVGSTSTPFAQLSVVAFNGGTNPLMLIASSSGALATSTLLSMDASGKLGLGTSSPYGTLSIQSNSSTTIPFSVSTTTTKTLAWIDAKGNQYSSGDLVTISSCGSGATVDAGSNNNVGRVHVGSTALQATCVITFADGGFTATSNAPSCDANVEGGLTLLVSASSTATAITFTSISAFNNDTFTYQCRGF